MIKKQVDEVLDQLPDDQYIAVGCRENKDRNVRGAQGSGFYFIGTVKKYWADIAGINSFFNPKVPLWEREVIDYWIRRIPGEPKMISILTKGREQGRCWTLNDYDKNYQPPAPKIRHLSGLYALREAISVRAVNDYEEIRMLGGNANEEREFFESDWGELITGADGKKIEEVCDLRVRYKKWRKKKGCGTKCKPKCIHKVGVHFVAWEKGDKTCPKEETL